MNSRKYWERRAAQDMYDRMGTAEDSAAEMNAAIRQTSAYLEKEVKAVMRGMQSFGISEAEAKKILNAAGDGTALQRLRKSAQQVGDPEKREALLNAINSAGAYRYRITRIEELNRDINRQCRELYKTENRHITSALRNVAEDSYYREIFSIQKGTGLGFSFSRFSRKDVDRILRSNWSGGNYSQRIWKDVSGMTARLKNELLVSMLSGRSGEKTARIFQERFGVNAFCARRLVRTESAYVANAAQSRAYDEAGIERYRFVATLDSRTCECCAALDGKVFELANAKPGTNYPPMHPFCRSTTIADFGEEELSRLERRAKDKDGNTVRVPADMTYEDWRREFVEGEKTLDKSGGSGIIKLSSKFVNPTDPLYINANKIKPVKGYGDIIIHGSPDSLLINGLNGEQWEYGAKEAAEMIRNSREFHGQPIRLVSCQTGAKNNGIAQQIADELGVEVMAPTEIANVDIDGEIFLSDNGELAEVWNTSSAEERKNIRQTGEWKVFKPNKR